MKLNHRIGQSCHYLAFSQVETLKHAYDLFVLYLRGSFVHLLQLKQRVFLVIVGLEMQQSLNLAGLFVLSRNWLLLGLFTFLKNVVMLLTKLKY